MASDRQQIPTGFASKEPVPFSELLAARWRAPRPSVLARRISPKGKRAGEAAASLGLHAVGDLLLHIPHRHLERGDIREIGQLKSGEDASVSVEVRTIETRRAWKRRGLTLTVATVADGTGPLEAVWFNQPWVARQLEVGSSVVLHGRYEGRGRFRVAEHEQGSPGVASTGEGGLVPVHPATEGLPARRIRELVAQARAAIADISDPLPAGLIAGERLAARPDAIDAIHFPSTPAAAEEARRRLAFDELLMLQLDLLHRRALREHGARAPVLDGPDQLIDRWLASLPFEPTGDQSDAMAAVARDLASGRPMQRLLMGEVGSGKTVVALHALLRAVECGGQAMLMAPTETLALQHMRSVERMLGGMPIPFALLTGSTSSATRREILARLAGGELSIVIGTHALIEPDVSVPRLAVCVVDEQHRFGVRQRAALPDRRADGLQPHVLHMTATPIPRTLALAAYGDLETSVLREMPPGRSPVETHIVSGGVARSRAYERIREEVSAGGRAFVVCPLVETSEAVEARAAVEEHDRLAAGPLAGLGLGLLHGRMSSADKEAAMIEFAEGRVDVLVSTTVIEVGIDVPEATVMLVENAERFGLAQLHQLRGRVGRGDKPGLCLLCGPKEARRLEAMASSTDGFELAELDLELRGEGELTGVRQSGLPRLRAASLPQDLPLLERANEAARALIEADPDLEGDLTGLLRAELSTRVADVPEGQIAA